GCEGNGEPGAVVRHIGVDGVAEDGGYEAEDHSAADLSGGDEQAGGQSVLLGPGAGDRADVRADVAHGESQPHDDGGDAEDQDAVERPEGLGPQGADE